MNIWTRRNFVEQTCVHVCSASRSGAMRWRWRRYQRSAFMQYACIQNGCKNARQPCRNRHRWPMPAIGHDAGIQNTCTTQFRIIPREESSERVERTERSERATSFVLLIHAVTGSCISPLLDARRRHRSERTLIVMSIVHDWRQRRLHSHKYFKQFSFDAKKCPIWMKRGKWNDRLVATKKHIGNWLTAACAFSCRSSTHAWTITRSKLRNEIIECAMHMLFAQRTQSIEKKNGDWCDKTMAIQFCHAPDETRHLCYAQNCSSINGLEIMWYMASCSINLQRFCARSHRGSGNKMGNHPPN